MSLVGLLSDKESSSDKVYSSVADSNKSSLAVFIVGFLLLSFFSWLSNYVFPKVKLA